MTSNLAKSKMEEETSSTGQTRYDVPEVVKILHAHLQNGVPLEALSALAHRINQHEGWEITAPIEIEDGYRVFWGRMKGVRLQDQDIEYACENASNLFNWELVEISLRLPPAIEAEIVRWGNGRFLRGLKLIAMGRTDDAALDELGSNNRHPLLHSLVPVPVKRVKLYRWMVPWLTRLGNGDIDAGLRRIYRAELADLKAEERTTT